jgi:hypothetical protein
MALSNWMAESLEDAVRDLTHMGEDLNSSKSPCCQEGRCDLWDDMDEARLHKRVTAVVKRLDEILGDLNRLSDKRRASKELTND